MTIQEAHKLIASLKAAYPRQEITPETLTVYTVHLTTLDYEIASDACKQHIADSPFFPTIAEVRSRAKAIQRGRNQPARDQDDVARLTPQQLDDLQQWAQNIGSKIADLEDEKQPMPGEDWFAEHAAEVQRLELRPPPRERDSA